MLPQEPRLTQSPSKRHGEPFELVRRDQANPQTSQATATAIPEFEEIPIAENTGLGDTELDLTQKAPPRTSLGVQEVIYNLQSYLAVKPHGNQQLFD